MDSITVKALLDTTGFTKGSQKLRSAIGGIAKNVKSISQSAQKSFNQVGGVARHIIPSIIGVGSAYQIITRAVSAFMQENKNLSATMSNVWASLGGLLGPIITQIINWVATAVNWFLQFLKLLGVASANANKAAKAAGGGAAALKKTLAGFDELNLLSDDSGGGGGGLGKSDFNPADLPDWLKALAEALRDKMWDEAADIIIGHINKLIATAKEKAYEWGKKVGEYFGAAVHIIARTIKEADWKGIGEAIASFLKGALEEIDPKELGTILVGKFVIMFEILRGFLEDPELFATIAKFLSGVVIGALDTLGEEIEKADFKKIGESIRAFFESIDWDGIRESFKTLLKNAVQAAIDLFWGLLDLPGDPPNFWENFSLVNVFKTLRTILVTAVQKAIDYLWTMVGLPGTPEDFWKNVKENTLSDEFQAKLVGAVQGAIDALWEALNLPGTPPNITELLSGIIEIIGTLSGTISTFVTDVFNGMLKPFLDYEGNGETGISAFITRLADALGSLSANISDSGIIDTLGSIAGTILEMVSATISTAADVIPTFITQIGNGLAKFPSATISTLASNLSKLYTDFILKCITAVGDSGLVESVLSSVLSFVQLVGEALNIALPLLISFMEDFVLPFIQVPIGIIQSIAEGFGVLFENLARLVSGEITFDEFMDNLWTSYYGPGGDDNFQHVLENLQEGCPAASDAVNTLADGMYSWAAAGDEETRSLMGLTPGLESFFNAVTGSEDGMDGATGAAKNFAEALSKLWEKYAEGDGLVNEYGEVLGGEIDLKNELVQATVAYLAELANEGNLTAENLEILKNQGLITDEYIQLLKDQGYIIEENGKVVQKTAEAVEGQANATKDAADAQKDAAGAIEDANKALDKTPGKADEAGKGYTDFGQDVEEGTSTVETETEDMVDGVDGSLEELEEETGDHFDATVEEAEDFAENFGEAVGEAADNANEGFQLNLSEISEEALREAEEAVARIAAVWDALKLLVPETAELITGSLTTFVTDNEQSINDFSDHVKEKMTSSFGEIDTDVSSKTSTMTSTITDFGTSTKDTVKSMADNTKIYMKQMLTAITSSWASAKGVVSGNVNAIKNTLSTKWTEIANASYVWGWDMIILLNNGMVEAFNSALSGTVADIAQYIKDMLGFSKPKKGPLSDADTYMPDFIKLMSEGLIDNIPTAAAAASKVADAISDEIQDGEYSFSNIEMDKGSGMMDSFSESILDGFADLIAKLEEIAKGVNFTMPTVAGGGFLPYGVPDFGWGDRPSESEEAILGAVDELSERINDLRDALENMQWVAQFGDLRMLSAEVKKYIKQSERAYG